MPSPWRNMIKNDVRKQKFEKENSNPIDSVVNRQDTRPK